MPPQTKSNKVIIVYRIVTWHRQIFIDRIDVNINLTCCDLRNCQLCLAILLFTYKYLIFKKSVFLISLKKYTHISNLNKNFLFIR